MRRIERLGRIGVWTAVGAAFLGLMIWLSAGTRSYAQIEDARANDAQVARGKYLVDVVAACGQCHTPRRGAEEDMSRYLAGHPSEMPAPKFSMDLMQQGIFISISPSYTAFAGPWGVSFAPNLTPDDQTGLGQWTKEQFVRAMRTGKHLGDPNRRPILPPMPWRHYQNMSAEDLDAIWAYLQTVKPIQNAVPPARNRFGNPYDD